MVNAARALLVPAAAAALSLGAVGAGAAAADTYVPPEEPTLTAEVFRPICDGDVPYLQYEVVPTGTDNTTVTITWLNPGGADVVQTGLPLSGQVPWPGAVVAADGSPLDWPGWRFVDGQWVEGDEFDWVRPSVSVKFEVNPEITLTADYPPSSPDCATEPPGNPPSTTPPSTPPGTPQETPAGTPGQTPDQTPGAVLTDVGGPGGTTGSVASLPRTGTQVAGLAALATVLVAAGALVVAVVRHRRAEH